VPYALGDHLSRPTFTGILGYSQGQVNTHLGGKCMQRGRSCKYGAVHKGPFWSPMAHYSSLVGLWREMCSPLRPLPVFSGKSPLGRQRGLIRRLVVGRAFLASYQQTLSGEAWVSPQAVICLFSDRKITSIWLEGCAAWSFEMDVRCVS